MSSWFSPVTAAAVSLVDTCKTIMTAWHSMPRKANKQSLQQQQGQPQRAGPQNKSVVDGNVLCAQTNKAAGGSEVVQHFH